MEEVHDSPSIGAKEDPVNTEGRDGSGKDSWVAVDGEEKFPVRTDHPYHMYSADRNFDIL